MLGRYQLKNLDPVNTAFLLLTPILGLGGLYFHLKYEGFHPSIWVLFFLYSWFSGIAITGGYHRLFAHRTYKVHPLIKLFYLLFGATAVQNSALKWADDHRIHHKEEDTQLDPYNIKEGFFYAHMGWVFLKGGYQGKMVRDLERDPLVMWQDRNYLAILVIVGFLIPLAFGFAVGAPIGGFFVVGFLRVVMVHHFTFFINSLCHMVGEAPYKDSLTARDNWLMAILTNGEGYHNFHHVFPADYRNGIKWYHWDPTKWAINTLEFFGLAHGLVKVNEAEIIKAKMEMQEKRLKEKHESIDLSTMHAFKERCLESLKGMQKLKEQYKAKRHELSKFDCVDLKNKMREAKEEFMFNLNQWQSLINNYQAAY